MLLLIKNDIELSELTQALRDAVARNRTIRENYGTQSILPENEAMRSGLIEANERRGLALSALLYRAEVMA